MSHNSVVSQMLDRSKYKLMTVIEGGLEDTVSRLVERLTLGRFKSVKLVMFFYLFCTYILVPVFLFLYREY